MANVIKLKRGSGSDPTANDLVVGEVAVRTDTGKLFTKKDNGTIAEISGAGGSDIFINTLSSSSGSGGGSATFNGTATRFTLSNPPDVSAQQLLVSVNGVVQKPNAGTSPSTGFAVDGNDIIFASAPETGASFFIVTYGTIGLGIPADNSVTSGKIADGAIVNADVNASAAIAGSKINPNFGSQDISTTGNLTLYGTNPTISFTDSNEDSDFRLFINAGKFKIQDASNSNADRFTVFTDGHIDIPGNLNCADGLDVTGNITVTGELNFIGNGVKYLDLATLNGSDSFTIRHQDGSTYETAAKFIANGDVELYHDNARKFQTQNHGITVSRDTGDAYTIVKALEDSSSADAAIRLQVTNDSARGMIQFGDGSDSDVGNIMYQHNDERMRFYVGAAEQFEANTNGIQLDDNKKTQFGNSNDLQIYHDGTNSIIANITGIFALQSNDLQLTDVTNSHPYIKCVRDAQVELYHDNAKKVETTSSGVTVTGTVTATSFSGDGSNLTGVGSDLVNDTSPQLGGTLDTNGQDILFNGAQNISWDSSAADLIFNDYAKLNLGTDKDFRAYQDGNNTILQSSNTSGGVYLQGALVQIGSETGEAGVKFVKDSSVELYHNNILRLETRTNDVKFHGGLVGIDNAQIQVGNSGDLKIYHDGTDSYVDNLITGNLRIRGNSAGAVELHPKGGQYGLRTIPDGATELYHSGNKKLQTATYGIDLRDQGIQDCFGINSGGNQFRMIVPTGTSGGFRILIHFQDGSFAFSDSIANFYNTGIEFKKDVSARDITPEANNTYDLGTSSLRWRNVYTNDLNLSNEGGANDVDGTWGSYTIQEGAEDLFLVNKRNGKKYKFNLTEVS